MSKIVERAATLIPGQRYWGYALDEGFSGSRAYQGAHANREDAVDAATLKYPTQTAIWVASGVCPDPAELVNFEEIVTVVNDFRDDPFSTKDWVTYDAEEAKAALTRWAHKYLRPVCWPVEQEERIIL